MHTPSGFAPTSGWPTPLVSELDELLDQSNAAASFKADVRRYVQTGQADHIALEGSSPRTKVTRLLKHILATAPGLELQHVSVRARSGCSDYIGTVQLQTSSESRVFEFVWCCRWRAEAEGWQDYYGLPDQIRAAREFDWRCFQSWTERPSA